MAGTTLLSVAGEGEAAAVDEAADAPPPTTTDREQRLAARDPLRNEALRLLQDGDAVGAEERARAVLAIEREVLGDDDPELIGTLDLIAQCQSTREAWDDALQTREDIVERSIAAYGEQDYRVVDARLAVQHIALLQGLTLDERRELADSTVQSRQGMQLCREGRYAEATVIAQQVIQTRRRLLGDRHSGYATSLYNLAYVYSLQEDTARAEPLFRQALEIWKEVLGERHPNYARRLNNLAELYDDQRDYARAEPLYRQASEIWKEVLGDRHPDYAASLHNLAFFYKAQGEYARAEPLYQQALQIWKEVLGERHPKYATSLSNLASLYKAQGEYARAEPLYRQALEIRRDALGERHPDYASSLHSLAGLYEAQGDYARAEPLYRQAMEIRKELLGERHPDYATSLNDLAILYVVQGDYSRAEPLHRQALEIRKEVLGERHPDYATSLNNLAGLYEAQRDYARAEPLLRQALEIKKQTLGERHPDYATSLHNLAALYSAQADFARAEPLYRQALEIWKEVLGEQHPDYAASVYCLAGLYVAQADYARAEPLLRQASEILKEALGERHPHYARSLHNLALLRSDLGSASEGLSLSQTAVEITAALLDSTAAIQSERQQLAMVRNASSFSDGLLSLAHLAEADADSFYPSLFASKGQVLMRQRVIRKLREQTAQTSDSPTAQTFALLADRARELDRLAKLVPAPDELDAHRKKLEDLTFEVERLQQTLATLSAEYRQSEQAIALTPSDLAARLPSGVALIDLREFDQYLPHDAEHSTGRWERQYAAFITRRDQSVVAVWLGPAESINAAVDTWREHFGTGSGALAGDELRRLVWAPLETILDGVTILLVSPDADLNLMPWGALPGREPDTYLIEERAFVMVPAPLLLPEMLDRREKMTDAPSLLAVGDVDYGADPGVIELAATDRSAMAARSSDGTWNWTPLANTRVEIVSIEDTFRRTFRRAPSVSLRDTDATEQQFRTEAPLCTYLHVATHGYFAPESLKSVFSATRAGDQSLSLFAQQDVSGWHPGLLSGIVLAGANQPADPERDDGVLTALEVAELDLSGVEMATLSACETGLGQSAGREGLLGLQRSFQLAGARTTVASLWKVPDAATRSLMVEFYENLWRKKMSRVEALRQAQLTMLRGELDRGISPADPDDESQRVPPYYWAAFVLSGDWR